MTRKGSARDAALWTLNAWGKTGARPESLVRQAFKKFSLERRDRALALELTYGALRNLTLLDHVLAGYIKETKRGVPAEIRDALRLAAYQALFLDKVPERAAVHEAVEQARAIGGEKAAGFVNAVLRAMLRGLGGTQRGLEGDKGECVNKSVIPACLGLGGTQQRLEGDKGGCVNKPVIPACLKRESSGFLRALRLADRETDPAGYLSILYSHPRWLAQRWITRFGPDEAEALMAAGNAQPPLTLRANTLRAARAELMARLSEAGMECTETRYSPDGVTVAGGMDVAEFPGYTEGLFAVQDEAAQLVSLLLAPGPGERVLDACAAPGGKTAHIAALSGGKAQITALDLGLDKLRLLKENAARLGVSARVINADAAGPLPFDVRFDAVLLDAPCSALGVIRRRPDIKYARTEADIARLAALQSAMLDNLAGYVKPGGRLVYSVCSTEPEEGELQVARFLEAHPEFAAEDAAGFLPAVARELLEGPYLRTYPHRHGVDGFFGARLVKSRG